MIDQLLADLTQLIHQAGDGGGALTPAIYDTAIGIHVAASPAADNLAWLLTQQQPDGGFGLPALPRTRDVPTLAALLALAPHQADPAMATASHAAEAFLTRHAAQWWQDTPEDIPVGAELIIPWLLQQMPPAWDLPRHSYTAVTALGHTRRRRIAQMAPQSGTAPIHSWEAWGTVPDPALLDATGGIGHSPAATLVWQQRADQPHGTPEYLRRATAATSSGAGRFPTVWPVDGFERTWVLYAIAVAGYLHHPALVDALEPQLQCLRHALGPTGMGMSPAFMPDGDITATALATLALAGDQGDWQVLNRFRDAHHYYTYPGELQRSVTTNAHVLHALALMDADTTVAATFLRSQQQPNGRWIGDKWHSSWLYTTSQVVIALAQQGWSPALDRGITALLAQQHRQGGWGMTAQATAAETAYALLALATVARANPFEQLITALAQGLRWLSPQLTRPSSTNYWIGKDSYCPVRVDRTFILCAALAASDVLARSQVRMLGA